jgi:deoxyadenosine/deoxycytidine kinase
VNRASPVIAILGSLAAGKTTLARGVARELGAPIFLESPRENPFLARMHDEPRANCFKNQLWFLTEALDSIVSAIETGGVLDHSVAEVVSVHSPLFEKYGWLSEAEFYMLACLTKTVSRRGRIEPDVYIALSADPADLIQRVYARGRVEDSVPSVQYLSDVSAAREKFVKDTMVPVVRVDASAVDIRHSAEVKTILTAVTRALDESRF